MADPLDHARTLEAMCRWRQLESCCLAILDVAPGDPEVSRMLGVALVGLGRADEAIEPLTVAVTSQPASGEAQVGLAHALVALRRPMEALERYRCAVTLQSNQLDWRCNLGALLADNGRHAEAIEQAEQVLLLDPDHFDALFNRANSLLALGDGQAAAEQFSRCARLRPDDARVYNNLGLALAASRDFDGAIAAYDRALWLRPDYVRALNNRGHAELSRFCPQRAVEDLNRALLLKPGYRAAQVNRGIALRALGQTHAALDSNRQAFPAPEALANASDILRDLNRGAEALECSRELWKLAPMMDDAAGIHHAACQAVAEWADYAARVEAMIAGVRAGRRPVRPFVFLSVTDTPEDQLTCARAYARTLAGGEPLWRGEVYDHRRIRVGYLSSEFKSHATAYLAAGIFEHHDTERFELFALSYGNCDVGDPMRARLVAAFEHFHDVDALSARQLAAKIRALEIDILVDLKGYTAGSRVEILAHRPAPIQVHYLGFPGTLGAPFVDYLIADRHVIPPTEQAHYAERIVYLPHCYQPADNRRAVSTSVWTRAGAGLPAGGPVLCAFHQTYKLNPPIWDLWMRLLARSPDATLWLIARDSAVPPRLAKEASSRGIDASRLVFAPPIAQPEHLARLRLADLFLDTGPVGAHTTASDALWVGVPVVALEGRGFASRVSASILRAGGLADCIATSLPEYETVVMQLLAEPNRLAELRHRIESTVRQSPLFDTEGVTRALEAGYVAMSERHRLHPAAAIEIAPVAAGSR